jgi:hypothetical protein
LAATGLEQAPVVGLHVPPVWHWSAAAQVTGFDPVQTPATHASVCVHAFPSLQVVPSVAVGFEQSPVLGAQTPATWHWSDAAQATGFEPVHRPVTHVSVWVHALPSLQLVPLVATGFEHVPVVGLHVPTVWHWSDAVQVTGFDPTQAPAWQVSVCVHALPSLHAVPLLTGVCVQAPAEQASAVQGLPSSQEPGHEGLPTRDPNPSWQVTVAPEFMTICAAASAPVNFEVLTVTSALVARNSASTWAPEFRLIPAVLSKYITSAFAVSPDPAAGPAYEPLLKLADPVTERVVAALTESVAPLFSVRDEKTYVPPVSESVAPEFTMTLP